MSKVKTTCYGTTKEWNNIEEAKNFFFNCMLCSEGSEQSRYTSIYMQLCLGHTDCSDEM